MRYLINIFLLFSLITSVSFAQETVTSKSKPVNVLVFSKTTGFRHNSISNGVKVLYELAQKEGWSVTATENPDLFTPLFLSNFQVVVFLNPTQDVLNEKQQVIFEKYMMTGKGFVGIHAAADCEYEWPWYGKLVGAYFKTHPVAQEGTVIFEDHNHPAMLPFKNMKSYTTFDEWYTFKENPRAKVTVLARLDETSLNNPGDGQWKMADHPVIWYQEFDGIRSFYTVFGHTPEAFDDENIRKHITGAINWAARRVD